MSGNEHGRALPNGLRYVDSWVEANFDRRFQLDGLINRLFQVAWEERNASSRAAR